jgi:hypothetical protein
MRAIETPLSKRLLSKEFAEGDEVLVTVAESGEELAFTKVERPASEVEEIALEPVEVEAEVDA